MLKKPEEKCSASELDSSIRFEADANREISELGDGRREHEVYELPGSEVEVGNRKDSLSFRGGEKAVKRREVGGPPISRFAAS